MGLFSAKPKLDRSDTHFLIQQVQSLKSQKSIAWVVKNEENEYLREIAIDKLDPIKWKKVLISIINNQNETDNIQRRAFLKLKEYVKIVQDPNKLIKISEYGLGIGERDKDICKIAKKRLSEINKKFKETQKSENNNLSTQKDIPEKRELNVIWEQTIPESNTYRDVPVAFSKDGKILVSGSGLKDKTIKLWNVTNGELLKSLEGHQAAINSISISPDGETLASGSNDKTIKIWNLASGKILKTLKGHKSFVKTITYSPDGKKIVSCDDKNIMLWDAGSGKLINTIKGDCLVIAISPDGKTIASSWIDGIKLIDVESRKILKKLKTDKDDLVVMASSIVFSPDGKIIALGGKSHRVVLWDLANGKALKKLSHKKGINSIAFSNDGKLLASCDDGNLKLWDMKTKKILCTKMLRTLPLLRMMHSFFLSVTFSPNGKLIGVGSINCIALLRIE